MIDHLLYVTGEIVHRVGAISGPLAVPVASGIHSDNPVSGLGQARCSVLPSVAALTTAVQQEHGPTVVRSPFFAAQAKTVFTGKCDGASDRFTH
jgi:hypothetical protein